jgi:hypothetical protein
MRVVIYARVSTADQSYEMQLINLRDYLASRAWEDAVRLSRYFIIAFFLHSIAAGVPVHSNRFFEAVNTTLNLPLPRL